MEPTTSSRHQALVLKSIEAGFQLEQLPTPQAGLGGAIVRIKSAGILSYHGDVYNGTRHYTFPTPLVGGTSAIGRISSVGPDSTGLKQGQLVFVDCVIRSRDDPDTLFLSAIHDSGREGSQKLMRDVWRDGNFAEYAKVPLENCIPLDESVLCGRLGYSIPDLAYMHWMLVAYGGLRDIGLQPGETVVVSPATGGFGGAGVQVALAMGARVIAMGRNESELERLKAQVLKSSSPGDIETVKMTRDEAADTATLQSFGTIDAVLDLSPPQACKSTHLRSATTALRHKGRVSMMGFNDIPYVPWTFVAKDITIKGKLMYEREDIVQFVKMLERGRFPRGAGLVETRTFRLEEWKEAFDVAAQHVGIGRQVVFTV